MKTLVEVTAGSYPVKWEYDSGNFHRITYGEQVRDFDDDLAAAHEFGECVRHSLECEGVFQEDEPEEREYTGPLTDKFRY